MLSMPPDTTISAEPAWMMSCASIVAFMPDPHTLLIVVAPVASGSFAPRAACRAGADHVRTELMGAERRKIAHEAAERRARGGYDDNGIRSCGHGDAPQFRAR